MFTLLAQKLTNKLCQHQLISTEEMPTYAYGAEVLIAYLFHIIASLSIGCLFQMLKEAIIFLLAYIIIRSFAGGIHASNHWRCFLSSCAILTIVLFILKYLPEPSYPLLILLCLPPAAIVITLLAPVADHHKPLDNLEYKVFQRKSRQILCLESFIIIFLFLTNQSYWALVITLALVLLALMLFLGQVKNQFLSL